MKYVKFEDVKDVLRKVSTTNINKCENEKEKQLLTDTIRDITDLLHKVNIMYCDIPEIQNTLREQTDYIIRLETTINTMMEVCKQ